MHSRCLCQVVLALVFWRCHADSEPMDINRDKVCTGAGEVDTAEDREACFLQLPASAQLRTTPSHSGIVDSNVHVWDTSADYPFDGGKPPADLGTAGSIENLTIANKKDGVDGSLIVQPINYLYDHGYITAVLQRYCQYRGEGLLHLALGPSGVAAQMRELASLKYVAFRYNPSLLDANQSLDGSTSDAVALTAAELGTPIAFMFYSGLDQYSSDLEKLISRHPNCNFIIEQMGFFLQPASGEGPRHIVEAAYIALLSLAKFPNVYVKVAALYRLYKCSVEELLPRFTHIFKQFGSQRLMWGSDFPLALPHGGISQSLKDIRFLLNAVDATPDQEEQLLGGTVKQLLHFRA